MHKMIKHLLLTAALSLLVTECLMAAAIFTPDSQPTGWVSRPSVTFFDLSSGSESFFQIDYRKDTWAGNVLSQDVSSLARILTTGPWDSADPTEVTAASLLNAANYSSDRTIATFRAAFRWDSLTVGEKTDIGSEAILNFVRGDRSNEEPDGLSFYQRESVLGDIVHSNIAFWDHGTEQTLYVGANDGMLHAFDANTGAEKFAYIPSMVIPNLWKLAEKTYVHTYFVDGPINIAKIDDSGTLKTILVGALGAGGAGLYALDITSPAVVSESNVGNKALWEITASGSFADLGYTYGTPVFTRLSSGIAAVVFGNGYVNSGSGRAVLYVVNAVTGGLVSAIDTGSGSVASPNGLSSPTLYDTDGDGVAEYAYAGDIDGNMWKFDLSTNSASLLLTTSPAQAITSAPEVRVHPYGGQMVVFATGRILTTGDKLDDRVHYVYGVWDGAPDSNNTLVSQTLTASTYDFDKVRTVSNNALSWAAGGSKGWKVALPAGERVVGEKPLYNSGRFYFVSTNPTSGTGENWLHELVFNTGGSPLGPIFDLNQDGSFDNGDLAFNGGIPVAKYLGTGVFSQPLLVHGVNLATTFYAFHPDLPIADGVPTDPPDPGVSGGHFDFDIYYYGDEVTSILTTPNYGEEEIVNNYCKKTSDVSKNLDSTYKGCEENAAEGYTYLSHYTTGAICKDNSDANKIEYYQTLTCNTITETEEISAPYKKVKHVHEYDDKYDVTGVNMLNASLAEMNLINAIPSKSTPFKILVMNQFLNPAAKLSVGGEDYESVKTYGGLATIGNAMSVLGLQPVYTQEDIGTLIFNLPLDAFKTKDWWNDGGQLRAGMIPTQTGCVNSVDVNGVQEEPGPNGERFNGSLAFQIIKAETPFEALEYNGPDVSYGWRIKQEVFTDWVLAEYTVFWHHPNKACYHDDDWIPDPPEDFDFGSKTADRAEGSEDPKDGIFGTAIISSETVTSEDGATTTISATYSDGTEWLKIVTVNDDGTTTIFQRFRDGTEETVTVFDGNGGEAGFIDPNTGSPLEQIDPGFQGRQSWRDVTN